MIARGLLLASAVVAASGAGAATPADQALGADIAAKMLPDGTYQKLMGGAMSKMMSGFADQVSAMPIGPFMQAAGLPESDAAKLGPTTIQQIMGIIDPAYRQRMDIMLPSMMKQMGDLMAGFEPQMREGLATAYASHFTAAQLADIDHFLNTPSGNAFAAQSMTIAADPAVMQKMQAFMPALMKAMPDIIRNAAAAAASLPKPKTPATLSDADRAKLAALLGVKPEAFETSPARPAS